MRKSSFKKRKPMIEKKYTRKIANTAVKIIERPFLVTLFITLSNVSSRITKSNNCSRKSTSVSVYLLSAMLINQSQYIGSEM